MIKHKSSNNSKVSGVAYHQVYNETYVKNLSAKAEALRSQVWDKVPAELIERLDVNKRKAVLTSVGKPHYTKRLFSPMIKNLMPDQLVPMDAPLTRVERNVIKYVAKVLYDTYGEPKFQYDEVYSEDCVRVKMGQALLRISPKVTGDPSIRRYENLQKYFGKSVFKPNAKIFAEAISFFKDMMNLPEISIPGDVRYIKGLFGGHSSNVGYPFFSNETKEIDGKMVRDITVDLTKQLNDKYGFGGMTAVPAIIIGRDQAGGIDFDLNSKPTYKELVKSIDTGKYKPSKARVVGAVDRLSNNNYNVILKGMIDHPAFKQNPLFCGFTSREDRLPLYHRFDKLARDLDMIPINIDFSAFDTTVGPELITMAVDLIRSVVKIANVNNDELYDALTAKAIYTKYTTMNPNNGRIENGSKATAIPSGLGWTGIIGIIVAQIAGLYGCISYYGRDHVSYLIRKAIEYKTFSQTGLGDDALGLVKKFEDLSPIADIIRKDLGLDISVESTKTAVGVDFLQELYGDGKILYPSGRTIASALYTERPSGLGWAQGDMKWGAQLGNIRQNDELVPIAGLISYYDKSRLGLREPKTQNKLSRQQFMSELKTENDMEESNSREKVHNGNPHMEDMFTDKGDLRKPWLNGFFSTSEKAFIFSDNNTLIASLRDKEGFSKGDVLKKLDLKTGKNQSVKDLND